MAYKTFQLDDIGQVTVYKRRNSRNIRLSVSHGGLIKVSLPSWLPYKAGTSYAASKKTWLEAQLAKRPAVRLVDGLAVGKTRRLRLITDNCAKPYTRVTPREVIVVYPRQLSEVNETVQQAAVKACHRALKDETKRFIPTRLELLAKDHGIKFKELEIRHLKSRWGSCDQNGRIKISFFVVILPNELIDYVLLHELVHTVHLNHGADFWSLMNKLDPVAKSHRKQLHDFSPAIL